MKLKKDIIFKSRIGTLEIKDRTINRYKLDIEVKGYKRLRMDVNGEIISKLNPNTLHYVYDVELSFNYTIYSI